MSSPIGRKVDAEDVAWESRVRSSLWPSLPSSVMVWMLYGVISAAPAAIHNDMAEAYVWGHEFQLGYEKHPPFWAWIAGFWFEVFPRADWAFTLPAVLNAGLGLYGCWMQRLTKSRRNSLSAIAMRNLVLVS